MEKIVKPGNVIEAHVKGPGFDETGYYYISSGESDSKTMEKHSGVSNYISATGYVNKFKGATVGTVIDAGNESYEILNIYEDGIELFDYLNKDAVVQVGSIVDIMQNSRRFFYFISDTDEKVADKNITVIKTSAPIYAYIDGKKPGYDRVVDIAGDPNFIHISRVYKDFDELKKADDMVRFLMYSNYVMPGNIVDVTIDDMPFTLFAIEDSKKLEQYGEKDEIETKFDLVHKGNPLYYAVMSKRKGDTTTYKSSGTEHTVHIDEIYESLKNYELMQEYKESLEELEQGEKIKN